MNAPSPAAPGPLNWALILLLGIVWGTSFLSIELALDGFPPLWVAAGRTGLASLALLAGTYVFGQGLAAIPSLRAWGFVAVIGTFGLAMPFTLLAWGQQFVPSAFAGVAMGAVPLLILPLAYMFLPDEDIGPRRIAGVCLGLLGLLILIGPGAMQGAGDMTLWGRLACLGATICYACGSVLTRKAPKMPPLPFAAATMTVAGLTMVPLALAGEGLPSTNAPHSAVIALVYCALIPTGFAAFLRVRIITTAGSVFMSLVAYMVPIWAVIFGITFMGETLSPVFFVALALILTGIGLSQWRSIRTLLIR